MGIRLWSTPVSVPPSFVPILPLCHAAFQINAQTNKRKQGTGLAMRDAGLTRDTIMAGDSFHWNKTMSPASERAPRPQVPHNSHKTCGLRRALLTWGRTKTKASYALALSRLAILLSHGCLQQCEPPKSAALLSLAESRHYPRWKVGQGYLGFRSKGFDEQGRLHKSPCRQLTSAQKLMSPPSQEPTHS